MTWRQAVHHLFDFDGAMEARDPFYVPPRMGEMMQFFGAGLSALTLASALFLIPITGEASALAVVAALSCAILTVMGARSRRYRLRRILAVRNLRLSLSEIELN